ncbi:MAG: ATP-binding protein [Pyrinomonadaceae bacterium]
MVDFQPFTRYNSVVFQRILKENIIEALTDTPVVLLVGARQSGKSTLVQNLETAEYKPTYLTFDDVTIMSAASENPKAFLESFQTPVIFDEIQRVPELLLPIKASVDKNRNAGRYLLTGSADIMMLPKVADSLAGRMQVINLRPLSQGEIAGRKDDFIDWVCGDQFDLPKSFPLENRKDLFERMFVGGFPEAVQRTSEKRRGAWFRSYITTLLRRDIRDLSNIERPADLARLFSILAARSGGLLNFADISRSAGIPQTTLKRYISILEQMFLIELIPAYSRNMTKRLTKSPKLYFIDTGILSNLQGLNWPRIRVENSLAGILTENFVVSEIRKQAEWSETKVEIFYFRTTTDQEVDIVLEMPNGEVVGIEIKSGAGIGSDAFKGLKILQSELGKKFKRGIVIYTGESSVAFAENMFAVPIGTLWNV